MRQQGCFLRAKNLSDPARRDVQRSFFGADFRSDKKTTAGNTSVLPRAATRYGRKSARKNRHGAYRPLPNQRCVGVWLRRNVRLRLPFLFAQPQTPFLRGQCEDMPDSLFDVKPICFLLRIRASALLSLLEIPASHHRASSLPHRGADVLEEKWVPVFHRKSGKRIRRLKQIESHTAPNCKRKQRLNGPS